MTKPNDGGPAFPSATQHYGDFSGMTLRQWYAGMALNQRLTPHWDDKFGEEHRDIKIVAEECFAIADAMIAEGEKGQP